jgi:putative colanic acid biosysnthesis UDP-glucose lipid carrier transferase
MATPVRRICYATKAIITTIWIISIGIPSNRAEYNKWSTDRIQIFIDLWSRGLNNYIIAIAIKLNSPGPVIFKQQRYGVKCEKIEVRKFRSMTVCENGGDIKQSTQNDPRFMPIGAFLRRTSLDELPQFLNVLQGTMTFVGPRPHAIAHNEYYRKQIQGYMLRHKVKPGITGQAQINGCRSETDTLDKMEARIHYDLEYIKQWSLWLDLKIVLLTIIKGFTSKQAYSP